MFMGPLYLLLLFHSFVHFFLQFFMSFFLYKDFLIMLKIHQLQVDFGEVFIPPSLDVPKPRVLPEFRRLAHGLRSSNISVLDAKTFYM